VQGVRCYDIAALLIVFPARNERSQLAHYLAISACATLHAHCIGVLLSPPLSTCFSCCSRLSGHTAHLLRVLPSLLKFFRHSCRQSSTARPEGYIYDTPRQMTILIFDLLGKVCRGGFAVWCPGRFFPVSGSIAAHLRCPVPGLVLPPF